MLDRFFVTLDGAGDRLLRSEPSPVQHLPRRRDPHRDVEHPADQRADPRQSPPLVLNPSGRRRTLLQHRQQALHLSLGQPRVRARCTLGRQRLLTTGNPGSPPRVGRLRRDLQRGSDLHRAHPVGEHPPGLPTYLFAAVSALRTNPTAIPLSHARTTRHANRRQSPETAMWTRGRP